MNHNRQFSIKPSLQLTFSVAMMAFLCLGLVGCKKPDDADKGAAKKTNEIKILAVETTVLKPQKFAQFLEYPGRAAPVETHRVSAESSGRVLSVPFEEGDIIKKGALMLRVDARMNSAQINVLKSQLSAANRELARTQKLAAEGLATPQQLDQSKSGVDQLRLSIKQAQTGLSMSAVRSGFTGYVKQKHVKKGEFIGAGAPVATLINFGTILVKINVPESVITDIEKGQSISLRFDALKKTIEGKVKRKEIIAEEPSQTYPVEVELDNKDGLILPGMRVVAKIPKKIMDNAIVVPRDAILEGVTRREAMIATDIKDNLGTARLKIVELGESKGNQIVITSGLKAGDKLITLGHRGIVDGTKVRIVQSKEQ